MKAQLVYENLDFERGIDPKTSLGIGLGEVANYISEFDKRAKKYGFYQIPIEKCPTSKYEVNDYIKDYMAWTDGNYNYLIFYKYLGNLRYPRIKVFGAHWPKDFIKKEVGDWPKGSQDDDWYRWVNSDDLWTKAFGFEPP